MICLSPIGSYCYRLFDASKIMTYVFCVQRIATLFCVFTYANIFVQVLQKHKYIRRFGHAPMC